MASITRSESGQVLVEYILLIFLVLMMTYALGSGLRTMTLKIWGAYTNQITAICPGCEPKTPAKVK